MINKDYDLVHETSKIVVGESPNKTHETSIIVEQETPVKESRGAWQRFKSMLTYKQKLVVLIFVSTLIVAILVGVLVSQTKKQKLSSQQQQDNNQEQNYTPPYIPNFVSPFTNPFLSPLPLLPSQSASYYNLYQAISISNISSNVQGILQYDYSKTPKVGTTQSNYGLDPRAIPAGANNQIQQNIQFQFYSLGFKTSYLKMTDADNPTRFKIPEQLIPPSKPNPTSRLEQLGLRLFKNPFSFQFVDVQEPSNVLLSTYGLTLIMMDKFIQMDFNIPSQRIFGLGEKTRGFKLQEGVYNLWINDQDEANTTTRRTQNTHGVHPFVLYQSKNAGDFVGVFFKNANAQSPVIKFKSDGTSLLSYITTGGIIEIYFFIHGVVKQIIQEYHNIIGKPNLPPFWSLGWNQASQKYTNKQILLNMMSQYLSKGLPLENIWIDTQYMNNQADFTFNQTAFSNTNDISSQIYQNNMHLVISVNSALQATDQTNYFVKQAILDKLLLMSPIQNDILYSDILTNNTVLFDWLQQATIDLWTEGLSTLYESISFDGINIITNDVTKQEKYSQQASTNPGTKIKATDEQNKWFESFNDQSKISTYNLPFIPGYNEQQSNGLYIFRRFDNGAIPLNATYPSNSVNDFNLHNLNNLISFASSGKYSSHTLDNNWADWSYLNYSIAGIMNMNMFGVPHSGADVCGYYGYKRNDELCARWIQLATFYPLARFNQNLTYLGNMSEDNEPYQLNEQYLAIAKASMYDRLQYVRQIYTCLYEVSVSGGTCFDPLFYTYPYDNNTFEQIESSFLVANAIKVSPILAPLTPRKPNYQSYFPIGSWVDLNDYSIINNTDKGRWITLSPKQTVNAHLKEGSLISKQINTNNYKTTTDITNNVPITLIANRDSNGQASGQLLLDIGNTLDELSKQQYEYMQFQLQANTLHKISLSGTKGIRNIPFYKLVIVNAQDLNNTDFACIIDINNNVASTLTVQYNSGNKTLEITAKSSYNIGKIRQISFGSSKNNDTNLCSSVMYQYKILGQIPDLSKAQTSFVLQHVPGVLPNLEFKICLQTYPHTIINTKWTFQNKSLEYQPFEVPEELVGGIVCNSSEPLSSYISYTNNPFQIFVKDNDGTKVLSILGQLLDTYLNTIKVQINTRSGLNFKGIFGLGEKVGPNFFLPDGTYSLWSYGASSPIELGDTPASNTYGVHPFYQYQVNANKWAGVFTKLAAAQDWQIKNNQNQGLVDITTIATGEALGKLWPGDVVYPDFFKDISLQWWENQLSRLYQTLKFDGLWLDLNEAANKCNGVCNQKQKPNKQLKYKLKYLPSGRDLESQSIPLDAYHSNNRSNLDTHSLFGIMEANATYHWYINHLRQRPYIVSRSSFSGLGKFASKWLGDNNSGVNMMGFSVTGTMMMNIFGIPLVGPDVCGFFSDTTPELCARWMVLGSFYPYSRNHNVYDAKPQEPYVFADVIYEGTLTYTDIIRTGMRKKYHLIRYYYTWLYLLSNPVKIYDDGAPMLYQPMFFEFPNNTGSYSDMTNNVMLGPSLKLSILANALGKNSASFNFPQGTWCNIFVPTEPCLNIGSQGENIVLRTKVYDSYVHLRNGHIVPLQDGTKLNVNNTIELQNYTVDFHILPLISADIKTSSAMGVYYNDDGLVLNTTNGGNLYKLIANGTLFNISLGQVAFSIQVQNLVTATKHLKGTCSAINSNDYIGSIYIYNAAMNKLQQRYKVTVIWKYGGQTEIGYAQINTKTDKVEFTPNETKTLCLSSIVKIDFVVVQI